MTEKENDLAAIDHILCRYVEQRKCLFDDLFKRSSQDRLTSTEVLLVAIGAVITSEIRRLADVVEETSRRKS